MCVKQTNEQQQKTLALESTETMFPGPLAEAMGCLRGTSTGDTKTDSFSPSAESMAVPSSLMVERIIFAYSKSTDVKDEMPLHWICFCEHTKPVPGNTQLKTKMRVCISLMFQSSI